MLRTYAACSGSECEIKSGDVMCTYASRTYVRGIKEGGEQVIGNDLFIFAV
jgi:hypothetical protein